ncbi:MAG: glycoside hydrolase family 38 C-terminal domain-containing protein [Opitutaceae bacterium]|nr:glycoside hydrolase family 38 C-terminal domain-containing protein [Opitutaceae bacterium]
MNCTRRVLFWLTLTMSVVLATGAEPPRPVFVVPNFHPASCGWLTDWSTERNYCANSYFDHLDRVRDDATYNFALSECNNLIAMLNFNPKRFDELKQRIREGRVELCNAFFLEPTINLSGGEALVKMGVEGLRWQQQVMGVRPRLSWMIDVTGVHEQMAQIVSGLGLDALVYCRLNPSGSTLHWLESPDGTRTLAISPGHYVDWRPMFGAKTPLDEKQRQALAEDIRVRLEPLAPDQDRQRPDAGDLKSPTRRTPAGAPVLILGGQGDYNLAPLCREYPALFLQQFKRTAPDYDVRFSTPSRYLDAVLPGLRSGAIQLPTVRGGTAFTYNAFWIQNPRVKSWYRQCEHQLQAAEMFATAASLGGSGKFAYPVQPLYHGWLQMLLNMDRNTLWGAAGGMVFEHERSWDVRDRFTSVARLSGETLAGAARDLAGVGTDVTVLNPLNWRRDDPVRLAAPVGPGCQALPGRDEVLGRLELPSMGLRGFKSAVVAPTAPRTIALPAVIETRHYRVRIDPATGALLSLRLKETDREILGGPANVVVAERPKKPVGPGDHMVERTARDRLADSSATAPTLTVSTGPLATVVEAESVFFGGGRLRRQMVFFHAHPRIEFETELNDIPDRTVVVAEFPFAAAVREVRRGVPYGFSHAAWAEPNAALAGVATGITPAVRWSHYQMADSGVALLDQGLSGREINDRTAILYLLNAVEKYRGYPNAWLSGVGRHVLRYALVAHPGAFAVARIPQLAWEFNAPPVVVDACAPSKALSFVQTSDNVIVEALRREGGEIELRLAECVGRAGTATVTLDLPHREAALTDLVGGRRQPLRGGPGYTFAVRPQQIVTLRFTTRAAVAEVTALTAWDPLVPAGKREALQRYLPDVKGHPPAGGK